jgi:hypothetical protein
MNYKLNQTQENDKDKKIEVYMQWVYLLAGILLIVASLAIFNSLKPLVENSYNAHAVDTSDPDTLLNHANTYYWWGRYRKNTLPEFDTAAVWAGRALQLAQSRFAQDKDTAAFMQRKLQAEQLIAQARQQADICKYNIASYIPTYMEIMGYDDDYMHEDADPEDVPNIALRGALGRLVDLFSPDKNLPVSSRTSFALVNVKTSNPMADEMLVQELNNKTRMYTIAPHELARIAGNDSTTVSMVLGDSIMMKKIAAAFSTDELAVIDFTENDKVNGIYYYGIRLKIWHAEKGWDSRNVYTEYMIRDRVFNQVTVFIGRLLLVVLLLALAINFILIPLSGWLANMKPVTPYYLLLCCIIAMITQYLMVTFGLKNFLNPTPDAYFVSDPGEQWTFAYPLTFILPGFITYLVLGKMDNFISSFRSDFENPLALFALVAGSLLPMAFSFTYYQTIRFGFSESTNAIFTIVLAALFIALAVSRYWSAIINFPQKMHWSVRLTTWLGFAGHILIAFLFISSLLQNYDNLSIDSWFLSSFLIPAGILESLCLLAAFAIRKSRPAVKNQFPEDEQPEDIQAITFENEAVIEKGKKYASLYVRSQRGATGRTAVESYLLGKLAPEEYLVIDFSVETKQSDVHYLPFAKAFEEKLSYNKFNDVAETARKTSNIIGKALSAITSAAGILIDEGQTKARNANELAELLLKKLARKKTLLLLDHIDKIDEENIRLLEALINKIIEYRQAFVSSYRAPQQLPVLIACGTGEYGYRDKVLTLLGRLRREGMEKDVLVFELKFTNVVENYLETQSLPIQANLHLKDLFIRAHRNYSPDLVKESFEVLKKNEILKLTDTPVGGDSMWMMSITDFSQLPEKRGLMDIEDAVLQHRELKDVMIGAAYIADEQGKFHLPVLANALKMDRIPLLHLLKEAEYYNLVYDLKEKEHFYWYAFTDRALVDDFKEVENPRQEAVSQLAYEYYRGYVEYYCPHTTTEANIHRLRQMIESGELSVDSLILLAKRSADVEKAFPILAFNIHHQTAGHIGTNGIARFDDALHIIKKAVEIYEGLNETERQNCAKQIFEIRRLWYRLLIETGTYRTENINKLYKDIEENSLYHELHDHEKQDLKCWKIRLCFTRFSSADDDLNTGNKLCAELLQSNLVDNHMRWRLQFYQLKLIPSVCLIYGMEGFNHEEVIRVNSAYTKLIVEIEASLTVQHSNELKELYREVLNDYAGSFLTDKLLSLFDPDQNKTSEEKIVVVFNHLGIESASQLFATIKAYLAKRISLELTELPNQEQKIKDQDVFDVEELKKLLKNNDKGIDKRGLCYTLNYYSRACRTVRDNSEALKFAILSFDFNTNVGDKLGTCIAAGTAGYATTNQSDAYAWFRKSFGIGWTINHFSRFTMFMHMLLMANRLNDEKRKKEAAFYGWQLAQLAVLPYFGKENASDALALCLLRSKAKLEEICGTSKIPKPYHLLGNNPDAFMETLTDILHQRIQVDNTLSIERKPGKWMMSPELEGIQLNIKSDTAAEILVLNAASIRDSGKWYIDKIGFQKIQPS